MDTVNPVVAQAGISAHHHHIARTQPKTVCLAAAGVVADPEQPFLAEADRHDGRIEILFVAVLMHAHPRLRIIEIHEAALGRAVIA